MMPFKQSVILTTKRGIQKPTLFRFVSSPLQFKQMREKSREGTVGTPTDVKKQTAQFAIIYQYS